MPLPRRPLLLAAALAACLAAGLGAMSPAAAQQGGPFAPRLVVNGRAITNWEFDQRLRMLTLFGAPGDLPSQAEKALIDERLQIGAAEAMGLTVTPEALRDGMTEFAGRANLSTEEFVAALGQGGVSEESFRDFVRAGTLWREVVRARFGPRAQVTEAEIDRAMANATEARGVRVLLSEIVIPIGEGGRPAAAAIAGRIRQQARSEEAFAAAAREYSRAGSASRGGELDWRTTGALPPAVAEAVTRLRPGQISAPVDVEGAVAIFRMRGIEQTDPQQAQATSVEYARAALPPGRDPAAEMAAIRARTDGCDDLYGVFRGAGEAALLRETRTTAELPKDLAMALALLDEGESTILARPGGGADLVMLCARLPVFRDAPSRDVMRNMLIGRRLSSYADGYLEELRTDAIIREF